MNYKKLEKKRLRLIKEIEDFQRKQRVNGYRVKFNEFKTPEEQETAKKNLRKELGLE